MLLIDLVVEDAITTNLQATDRQGVIKELVEALAAAGKISSEHVDSIVKSIIKREKIGSTGIGNGIAIPHTSHKSVENVMVAFGRSAKGVNFNALDGEPVYLFFLELSSEDQQAEHLGAMRSIVKAARDEKYCKFLRQAKTTDDILDILTEADEETN